ncbi:MAG: hypothetical protein ACRD1E_02710 [Terriglobales bacterium]
MASAAADIEAAMRPKLALWALLLMPLLPFRTRRALVGPAQLPDAVTITVHWADGKTNLPLPHFDFVIYYDYFPGRRSDGSPVPIARQHLFGRTDQNGVATVQLLAPGPIVIITSGDSNTNSCSPDEFCTSDIVAHGVAAERTCLPKNRPAPPQPVAKPGEVFKYSQKRGIFGGGMSWDVYRRDRAWNDAVEKKCPFPKL